MIGARSMYDQPGVMAVARAYGPNGYDKIGDPKLKEE